MDRQARIDFILEHFEEPCRYGPLPDPTVTQKGGNPGCGDIVTMYLKVTEDDVVTDISFEGDGCTISQAAASMVVEMFEGKTLEDIENSSADVIFDMLGRELAATRPRCSTLGLETAKQAVKKLRRARLMQELGIELPEPEAVDGLVFDEDDVGA